MSVKGSEWESLPTLSIRKLRSPMVNDCNPWMSHIHPVFPDEDFAGCDPSLLLAEEIVLQTYSPPIPAAVSHYALHHQHAQNLLGPSQTGNKWSPASSTAASPSRMSC